MAMSTCVRSDSPWTTIGLSWMTVFEALRSATSCEISPPNSNSCRLGSIRAATRPQDPLCGCRICEQLGGRTTRSGHELTAATRTSACENCTGTRSTVGALERTYECVCRIGWQVAIATFAVRAQLKHRSPLLERNRSIGMLPNDTGVQRRAHEGAQRPTRPAATTAGLAGVPAMMPRPDVTRGVLQTFVIVKAIP